MTGKQIQLVLTNWAVFLACVLGAALVFFLLHLFLRFLRAARKRHKAVRKLRRTAEENGYVFTQTGPLYKNLHWPGATQSVLLENGEKQYKLYFVSVAKRKRVVKFLYPGVYTVSRVSGYTLLDRHALRGHAILHTPFGKDKDNQERERVLRERYKEEVPMFRYLHSETFENQKGTYYILDLMLTEEDDAIKGKKDTYTSEGKRIVPVVLFNPVPMRAHCIVGSADKVLVGGECYQGVYYHDVSSFCAYIAHGI